VSNERLADSKNSRRIVLPGDRLASIEEFVSGSGSFTTGEAVVSTRVGEVSKDMKNQAISVRPAVAHVNLPKVDDLVSGVVQSAQSSVAQVRIDAINDVPNQKNFTGMLSLRDDRRRRTSSPIKPGDLIRARVISTVNAIFHLSLECPECGVLYTVCNVCGGSVVALSKDRVKCRECGWVEERLLSEDFIKLSRAQASS